MTSPASSDEEHRGHFCPGLTKGFLPCKPASASTEWVHIGQYTNALAMFAIPVFIASSKVPFSHSDAGMEKKVLINLVADSGGRSRGGMPTSEESAGFLDQRIAHRYSQ